MSEEKVLKGVHPCKRRAKQLRVDNLTLAPSGQSCLPPCVQLLFMVTVFLKKLGTFSPRPLAFVPSNVIAALVTVTFIALR